MFTMTPRFLRSLVPAASLVAFACTGSGPAPTLTLTLEQPTTVDDLVVGRAAGQNLAWKRDGESISWVADVLPSDFTTKGQTWSVSRQSVDGDGPASVTIANSPPVVASIDVPAKMGAADLAPDPVVVTPTRTRSAST